AGQSCGWTWSGRGSLIGFLPQLFEFLLETFLEHLRGPNEGLEDHFLVRTSLQRKGRLKHGLEGPVPERLLCRREFHGESLNYWMPPSPPRIVSLQSSRAPCGSSGFVRRI